MTIVRMKSVRERLTKPDTDPHAKYRLLGHVDHFGTLDFGHYTSYIVVWLTDIDLVIPTLREGGWNLMIRL